MATPSDADDGSLDDDYEEYVEFQCPLCQTPVADDDPSCPGCGAVFVDSAEEASEAPVDDMELEEDYELDEDIDYDDLDEEALEAELEAMETDLESMDTDLDDMGTDLPLEDDDLQLDDSDPFDLDLSYEDDLEEEEEIEEVFGTHVRVEAGDHLALEEMSKPTLIESTFQRMGLGLFIAGGVATVMVVLWDPINGNPIGLGMTQWRFLVLALSMFIVGFVIEMLHAASLAKADDLAFQDLMDG